MTLPDEAAGRKLPEIFEPATPPTSLFGPLTATQLAALSRYALRFGGITTALGIIFIPSSGGAIREGTLPDRPDISFKYDVPAGLLTLWEDTPYGRIIIYQDNFGIGGIFRDRLGRPIARILPDGTLLIAPDNLPELNPNPNDPKLCPDPTKDQPGAREKDRAYQDYISTRVNGQALPQGLTVMLFNPVTGKWIHFDDCDLRTGTMLEMKGTGYQALKDKSKKVWDDFIVPKMWKQAIDQIQAAGGRPIRWYFAENGIAGYFRDLFREGGLKKISVIWAPLP